MLNKPKDIEELNVIVKSLRILAWKYCEIRKSRLENIDFIMIDR